ncbi:MAG: M23 family metallopeptidase [Gemmatimonadetes bacterium]|nr:M23 family metallopeptidase [Gemmatimonadota bacterium]
MDDRQLTLIIVPHSDLETRSYEVSYRRLKLVIVLAVAILLFIGFVVASWFPVAAQAGRVPALVEELQQLEVERAKVVELAQTLSEVEAQYERVRVLLGADASNDSTPALPPLGRGAGPPAGVATGTRPDTWPLDTRGFVTESRENPAGRRDHPGLDIAVPVNSAIRAAGDGIVTTAASDSIYGAHVIIDHGDGVESLYGHASRLFVQPGERVRRRQVIAITGSTGRTSAPHLHFEIRQNGQAVDPTSFVRRP